MRSLKEAATSIWLFLRSERAEHHHRLRNSQWTAMRVEERRIDNVLRLLRLSYLRRIFFFIESLIFPLTA